MPGPDKIFEGPVHVGERKLELDFGGARYFKNDDGSYTLQLSDRKAGVGCDLTFHPEKPVTRHGDDGVVRGPTGEDMFYYFIPRCRVDGNVTFRGTRARRSPQGQGWYDHEFGGMRADDRPEEETTKDLEKATQEKRVDVAWNWAAVQLDNGEELSAYALVRVDDGKVLGQWAIHIDTAGYRHDYNDDDVRAVAAVALDAHVLRLSAGVEAVGAGGADRADASTPPSPIRSSSPASRSPRSGRAACEVRGTVGGEPVARPRLRRALGLRAGARPRRILRRRRRGGAQVGRGADAARAFARRRCAS